MWTIIETYNRAGMVALRVLWVHTLLCVFFMGCYIMLGYLRLFATDFDLSAVKTYFGYIYLLFPCTGAALTYWQMRNQFSLTAGLCASVLSFALLKEGGIILIFIGGMYIVKLDGRTL